MAITRYKANFKELRHKVEDLNLARGHIRGLVAAEIRNGKQIRIIVQRWLDEVDEITRVARQLFEDRHHEKIGCTKCSFPNLRWKYGPSKKAKELEKFVVSLIEAGKFDVVTTPDRVSFSSSTSLFIDFESRIPIRNEMMQALADHEVSILGVYGSGGVGKSTLVEQVAGMAQLDGLFSKVVKSSVTRSPDLERIQGEIADQLGLEFTEETMVDKANRLRERINKGKDVLIILDDVRVPIKLEEIGIPYLGNINLEERELISGDYHLGCKVLLASRNKNVLNEMESQKDFELEALSEEEARSLLEVMAGDVAKDTSYQDIASEVAKKCACLPIIIVTVAKALKNKGIPIWEEALSKLAGVDNKELHEITYSAMELIYSQLDNDEVKALFLLCGVVGPQVLVQNLLKYVLGLGIFKRINTVEHARNRLYRMISALKASGLLLEDDDDTSVEFVKMQGVVHEVAISIASRNEYAFIMKEDFGLKEWLTTDLLKWCPGIILHRCIIQKLLERFEEGEGITQEISEIIRSGPLHVVDHPVGLTYRVKKVISLLNLQFSYDVNVVGIYGICGRGKSVIARAVYNLIANLFQGSCFLPDVRENEIRHGLVYLQETFLSEITGKKDIKLGHVNKGISIIQTWLRTKKVLLILDNIDKSKQLQSIVGGLDWFGPGTRIIVTTRDKDLLLSHGVEKIYDVEEFNQEEALELFTWNAFKGEKMDSSYMDISKQIILSCNGLPLALEIVGSKLCCKNVEVWNTLFENPRRKIKEVFQASYKGWEEDEKEIFIDIMTRAAQSSTSFVNENYDVFLCFRGEDTRYNFTGHLYHALQQNRIRTFMDEELKGGEEISATLCKAIEESRIAIIVFSKNFAFSRWCLDELVRILECKRGKDQLVLPLFYNVEPTEVRHQLGSYAEALAKHEEGLEDDKGKLQRWRSALHEAANLSGWHLKYGHEYEYEFIERIVKDVAEKIN